MRPVPAPSDAKRRLGFNVRDLYVCQWRDYVYLVRDDEAIIVLHDGDRARIETHPERMLLIHSAAPLRRVAFDRIAGWDNSDSDGDGDDDERDCLRILYNGPQDQAVRHTGGMQGAVVLFIERIQAETEHAIDTLFYGDDDDDDDETRRESMARFAV